MSQEGACQYKSFRVRGLPAGVLGENYVTVTAIISHDRHYECEWFVLSKVAEPHLYADTFSMSPTDIPDELRQEIDHDYLLQEARQYAENYIFATVADIAQKKQRPQILDYPFELIEMPYAPLVGCWMRGLFHDEIRKMAQATKCNRLKLYLTLAMQSRVLRPGP